MTVGVIFLVLFFFLTEAKKKMTIETGKSMSEACHARNEGLPSPQHPQDEAGCQDCSRCVQSRRRCLNLNCCLNRCLNQGDQSCLLRPSSRCVDLQPYLRCDAAGRWREQRTSVRAGFVMLLMYVLSRLSVRVSLSIRIEWYLLFSLLACIGNRLTIAFLFGSGCIIQRPVQALVCYSTKIDGKSTALPLGVQPE
jgi:hypothetical protein